tara:strand:- start:733 stop:957 length:225 start_codon:yes stop_codon:yes gene_type:complete
MTKKKKILNGIIFLGGLIVFAVYYFNDNEDMGVKEEEQDVSAEKSGDTNLNALDKLVSEDFDEIEFISDSVLTE